MSSCEGHLEALSALLDGELGPEEELELRRHVDSCETCRAWHAQLEALSTGIVHSIGRERAPRLLVHRVRRLQASSARGRATAGTAAGVALFAALVLLGQMSGSDEGASRLVEDHRWFVSGETIAVVASVPETAKAFQKAAWIVGSL